MALGLQQGSDAAGSSTGQHGCRQSQQGMTQEGHHGAHSSTQSERTVGSHIGNVQHPIA